MARPKMQRVNNALLGVVLHGAGFNNHGNSRSTGEAHVIDLLKTLGGTLVLDVGANVGDWSREVLKRTTANVIAFEPLPAAAKKARLLEGEFPGRVHVREVAIGASEGYADIFADTQESEGATLSREALGVQYLRDRHMTVTRVPVETLDLAVSKSHLVQEPRTEIDLLKIDTEGWELEVLDGARQLIKDSSPKLVQIEYNWHHLFRGHTLYSIADSLKGYQVFQILPYGRGLVARDVASPNVNVFWYSNFLFVRNDVALHLNL